MKAARPDRPRPAGFLRGRDDDYPVFMPVAKPGRSLSPSIAFCRAIHPDASVLALPITHSSRHSLQPDPDFEERVLQDLSKDLDDAVASFDLALVPIIVIGYGSGANLATEFALRKNPNLAAAILFRPTVQVSFAPMRSLDGLSVLLVTTGRADHIGTPEWRIDNAFSAAGAQVIREISSSRSTYNNHNASLARVFIAAQFGLSS